VNDLERNVHAVADEIRDAERNLYDGSGGPWEWAGDQLEIYHDVRISGGESELRSVGVLCTYGGPTIRATVDPSDPDVVRISGTWAGDRFETEIDAQGVAGAMLAIAEEGGAS
jgi:hypothetical protein